MYVKTAELNIILQSLSAQTQPQSDVNSKCHSVYDNLYTSS